jgi:hypothetical protein
MHFLVVKVLISQRKLSAQSTVGNASNVAAA